MRILVSVLVLFISVLSYANTTCGGALVSINDADFSWRKQFMHPLASGNAFKTDASREKQIQDGLKNMRDELDGKFAGHNDTPPMVVVPTSGTKITFTKPWEEYSKMVAKVSGAQDGVLRATVLLPVSGHTGLANAKKWATTDTYTLTYDNGSGKEVTLVKDAKSLDLITSQEVEIPLIDGKPVTLYYYRSGSGGPNGYGGGRILEMTWDKRDSDTSPSDYSKPFWIRKS